MKDYYQILGLDNDTSPDSIKGAYRRLAREAHPDRAGHLGEEAQAQASQRMADLNEAYATLSDPSKRKEYDQEFAKWQARVASGAPEPEPEPVPAPEPETPAVQRPASRPTPQVSSNVVHQFATQVHARLFQNNSDFAWRGMQMEGFDWAMQSGFFFAEYFIALRGFGTVDQAAVSKFVNYATIGIEKSKRLLKKNYYLLLLPFQRMREPEIVLAACRRFAGQSGEGPMANTQLQVVLMDVSHGRSVPCGPRIEDKRFELLAQRLGLK